ncbi:hypothetical protein NDU88_007573 [Pleurodeles waltl]|uniref:Uncharacterized protein n=1 Tax=Pleurodeles waltl TaxID=8319 RepID=A0AAV7SSV7_PLEWA|nr:hypothetical protein NDU88_007573 [Pleurodeles waltl]
MELPHGTQLRVVTSGVLFVPHLGAWRRSTVQSQGGSWCGDRQPAQQRAALGSSREEEDAGKHPDLVEQQ